MTSRQLPTTNRTERSIITPSSQGAPQCSDAATQAEESTSRLATLLRDSNDALIVHDFAGRITAWNRGAERIYGFGESEAIGRNILEIVPEECHAEFWSTVQRVRSGISESFETRRLAKDGRHLDIWLTVGRLVNETGQAIAIATTERDITEHKALQREVLEIAADKQRQIGHALHDGIGQELTALGLFAAALEEKLHAPELKQQLDAASWLQLHQTATRIRDGLRDTSRNVRQLVRGMVPVLVDVAGLPCALRELTASVNIPPHITCQLDCDTEMEGVDNSIATHLYHIAQEAIHNALKHSQANLIHVSLRNDPGQLVLEITDNGVGVAVRQPGGPATLGIGTQIMRYRANLIGATLNTGTCPTGGTTILCTRRNDFR